MTMTIELPDELASRLNALLPEEERGSFAVSAIADALLAQERDSAECIAAVEEAIADMETGRSVSFEEEEARWQQQITAMLPKASVHAARFCPTHNVHPGPYN
jgi:predicted transcriptional regulator